MRKNLVCNFQQTQDIFFSNGCCCHWASAPVDQTEHGFSRPPANSLSIICLHQLLKLWLTLICSLGQNLTGKINSLLLLIWVDAQVNSGVNHLYSFTVWSSFCSPIGWIPAACLKKEFHSWFVCLLLCSPLLWVCGRRNNHSLVPPALHIPSRVGFALVYRLFSASNHDVRAQRQTVSVNRQ